MISIIHNQFRHAYDEPSEAPQRHSLADRRGSREFHIDIGQPEPPLFSNDTLNPKSSEPLLGNKTNVFFDGLGEDNSPTEDCDVVHNASAMERSLSPDPLEKSSNGNIPLRGSIETGKNSELSTIEQPL